MTDSQSSYVVVRSRSRYLKDVTVSSGFPYALKVVAGPANVFSSSVRLLLRSAPHVQRSGVSWRRLSSAQGTNVSQAGQREWVRFPSSRIIIVSYTWHYTKWIRSLVCVVACPPQPSTGHPNEPAALGKETL